MDALNVTYFVRDESGKRHRGSLAVSAAVPPRGPSPPDEFQIVLVDAPLSHVRTPDATAICLPGIAPAVSERAPGTLTAARLKRGDLPAGLHSRFAAGRVMHPAGELNPKSVFPSAGPAHFEPLALMLIDQARAEALAPYTALIRTELRLGAGTNAVLGLDARLHPSHVDARPPARAPAVLRLNRALKSLHRGEAPTDDLQSFGDDLRFLALFDEGGSVLSGDALDRLLADVQTDAPPSARRTAAVTPLRPHKPR